MRTQASRKRIPTTSSRHSSTAFRKSPRLSFRLRVCSLARNAVRERTMPNTA